MASPALIAGAVVLLGGGAFLLWRKRQQQQNVCAQACAGDAECLAACNIGGAVLTELDSLLHTGRSNKQVLADEAKQNNALNGKIKTPNKRLDPTKTDAYAKYVSPWPTDPSKVGPTPEERALQEWLGNGPSDGAVDHRTASGTTESGRGVAVPFGLGGDALEYENGCVPFKGAAGWSKCAPGTFDMFGEENRVLAEDVLVDDNVDKWRRVATRPVSVDGTVHGIIAVTDPSILFSGSIDPLRPDPTTQGPIANPDGTETWLIAGKPLTCGRGDRPVMRDATHVQIPGKCAGRGSSVAAVAGQDCPAAGFTWDQQNGKPYVRRMRVGETKQTCKSQLPGASSSTQPPVLVHNVQVHL